MSSVCFERQLQVSESAGDGSGCSEKHPAPVAFSDGESLVCCVSLLDDAKVSASTSSWLAGDWPDNGWARLTTF